MPDKEWLILKSVVTQDQTKNKRIGHGDGGLGTVEYYEDLSGMIQNIIDAGLINVGGDVRYNAGAAKNIECWVTATNYGITAEKYGVNGVRIYVPASVMLKSFRLNGDASFLSENQLELSIYEAAGKSYNQDNASSYYPVITVMSRNQLFQDDPFVQRPHDAGGIDIFHFPITTPGLCKSQITGLSGEWGLMGSL